MLAGENVENAMAKPELALKAIGLVVFQTRVTTRTTRKIFQGAAKRKAVAELAVDEVEYVFSPVQRVHLHEIEIEDKGGGGSVIKAVSACLLDHFGHKLRAWPYSKIITGKTIEAILKDGVPEDFLDYGDNLTPSGIEEIEARLKKE